MAEPPISLVAAIAAKETERLTAPDRDAIVAFLEEQLALAKAGDLWAIGYVLVIRPVTKEQATQWSTRFGSIGSTHAPMTFLGASVTYLACTERLLSGLPYNGDDVPGNPSPLSAG